MERYLIQHCAPTLAGLKTANMFTVAYTSQQTLDAAIDRLNACLIVKGIYVVVLRNANQKALVYIYRKNRLEADLNQAPTRCFLQRHGYHYTAAQQAVDILKTRTQSLACFPHEIGLFLSYPIEDVEGYIQHRGQNCRASGYWKVYSNEQEAIKLFAKFRKCTDVYLRHWHKGKSVMQLTVAA